MQKIKLSVVIPAYNEEESLKKDVLNLVYKYLKKQKYTWEVLIANDGSTDNTSKLVRSFIKTHKGFKILDEPHRGKGGTVIAGMLAAHGEIVLFTDMDQSTPIKHIEDFLPKFEKSFDIVIGSRTGRKGAPLFRKIMALGFVVLRAVVLQLPFRDTQCGFKAFTNEASQEIFSKMKHFSEQKNIKGAAVNAGFDIEFLYIARKMGYKIAEVPVKWDFGERRAVNPIKDSLEALKDIFRIRFK